MLVEQYLIIMIAAFVTYYIAITANSPKQRLLVGMSGILINAYAAFSAYSVDVVEVVEDSEGSLVVESFQYADETLAIFFAILSIVLIIYVITGAYNNIKE